MFGYPATGGGPTTPLTAYGAAGGPPRPSYASPDDYTVIWWDATAKGADEQGATGAGLYRFVAGGKRYKAGVIPRKPISLFSDPGTVLRYDVPPTIHSAPTFPGSPTASKHAGG